MLCVLRLCERGGMTFTLHMHEVAHASGYKIKSKRKCHQWKDSLIPLNNDISSSPLKEGIDEEETKRRNVSTSYEVIASKLYVLTWLCVRCNTNFGCSDLTWNIMVCRNINRPNSMASLPRLRLWYNNPALNYWWCLVSPILFVKCYTKGCSHTLRALRWSASKILLR